jgi:glycosyltransferase involved in cell wall biosynthesis
MDYFGAAADRIINEFQPDIVECQHIWIMDYVLEQKGYSHISVAHHSDQMGFRYDTRMRAYAAHIFAISESVREEVLSLYPVTVEKVSVCANGCDQRAFRPRRVQRRKLLAAHHLEDYEDMPIITFAGKISKTKGADYLLRANRIIQRQKDTLVLIFGAGQLEDVVNPEMREEYELRNVVVMGHQPQDVPARFHSIARLSVLPSRSEGFGIAALEAMGCGIPVQASDTGGLHDFIVGSLVPCGDSRAIADRVLALLALPESAYRNLCEEALAKARRCSWAEIVRKRLRVYARVSGVAIPPVRIEPERAAARGSSES